MKKPKNTEIRKTREEITLDAEDYKILDKVNAQIWKELCDGPFKKYVRSKGMNNA